MISKFIYGNYQLNTGVNRRLLEAHAVGNFVEDSTMVNFFINHNNAFLCDLILHEFGQLMFDFLQINLLQGIDESSHAWDLFVNILWVKMVSVVVSMQPK